MAEIDMHIRDCKFFLGSGYKDVHIWLDQFTKMFPTGIFNDYHRTFLHNHYGIKILEDTMNKDIVLAAKIHIIRDYDDKIDLRKKYVKKEDIEGVYKKAVMWFNDIRNMDIHLYPDIIKGWGGKALVALAI